MAESNTLNIPFTVCSKNTNPCLLPISFKIHSVSNFILVMQNMLHHDDVT